MRAYRVKTWIDPETNKKYVTVQRYFYDIMENLSFVRHEESNLKKQIAGIKKEMLRTHDAHLKDQRENRWGSNSSLVKNRVRFEFELIKRIEEIYDRDRKA